MRAIPKIPLLIAFGVSAALSYFAWFFASWGSYSHGGTPAGRILIDVALVLAVFFGIEVVRSPFGLAVRISSAMVVLPLALFAVGSLAYAIYYLVAV